ncbi:NAD-dependent succinate-semialdehyde dehydrogenase [Heyndrickxia oleronia]|uniref:NAD-dependent succinate-semialdehyde dehydrogenase n=1 Tax=Heyndrickxia oleronia TaxID=38875 RepID=UPI001B287376|nr:NAD-dependent succinate-semialdehyde dehydrogenase [Heyndrickxia oleronia]GIN40837.1 NAD-dependent succinate-semialdehyde dehydrogenase [Heyndrickxia oleronia]
MLVGQKEKGIFINGEWRDSYSGTVRAIINPATLEKLTEISYGGKEEALEAVEEAKAAFPSWSKKTARERSTFLYKAYEKMLENKEQLAQILTSEQGKPLTEARTEIESAASYLLWYAEEANRVYGEIIPSSKVNRRSLVIPQAIGVIAAITPWNFPASMVTRKLGPSLAAGCTVVLKPASQTPLTAMAIVKIFEEVGLPKGVLNLVSGDAKGVGEALTQSPDVRLITFTGSTEVGRELMKNSAQHIKKLSLELGGHAPILVMDDADLENAVDLTLASKFRNCGQTCICANRVYVHREIADSFVEKLAVKVKSMKIGNGIDEATVIGPMIDRNAVEKAAEHVEDAVHQGATIITGGKEWQGNLGGHFYEPTILVDVNDQMKVMNEETFGPVLPIETFDSIEEVIEKANQLPYGLAAYIMTESTNRVFQLSEALEYGIIGVNDVFPATAEAPFGGIKESGFGKEGGKEGIMEFVEMKYVSIGMTN